MRTVLHETQPLLLRRDSQEPRPAEVLILPQPSLKRPDANPGTAQQFREYANDALRNRMRNP